jgi:hypothetical protein
VVAGELTLRADGSFSLMRLEVPVEAYPRVEHVDHVISDVHAREGVYTLQVESSPVHAARLLLRLHATRSVRTVARDTCVCTEDVGEKIEVEVVVRSPSELHAVAHEAGGDVEYGFGR